MGGTSSKHQETRDGWKASLLRSASVPTSRNRMEKESVPKALWKSRLFSMPRSYSRGKTTELDGVMSKLKPLKEDEAELDFEYHRGGLETDEYVNGCSRERDDGSPTSVCQGRLLNRCATFQPVAEAECQRRLVAPHRNPGAGGEYTTSSSRPRSRNRPYRDLMDQNMGLRVLLSPPPQSSSPSLVSSSRGANHFERSLSTKGSFNSRRGNEFTKRAFSRVCMDDASLLEPQWITAPNVLGEADVPLFDPFLLATVEKAVEDMAFSTPQSSPAVASESAFVSSDTGKDAVVAKLVEDTSRTIPRLKSLRSRSAREDRRDGTSPQIRTMSFLKRKLSFSKVLSLKNDEQNWSSQAYLDQFLRLCPPGCEGKVVLYFTSLRGVRKTFENCCMLRLILQGFRVHVDERDVWMHSKFRQELTDVLGVALSVPRLFILGRYIGGADEVEVLHEEGILSKLLEELPRECRRVCNVCADVRFIPCTACSGSCKIVISNDVTERCSKCNENGLIMCPMCD